MAVSENEALAAAKALKILNLCNSPGMDAVAVKLNCGLNYHEHQAALRWMEALNMAIDGGNAWEIAEALGAKRD
jgi:hypothetical protein